MSSDEANDDMLIKDDVEETNQADMDTSQQNDVDAEPSQQDGETPMEETAEGKEENKDEKEEKKDEEDENTLNLRRPYPNLLTISRLRLEDIKIAVSELSQFWDDTTCLTIRYIKEKTGNRKGFMRMKFASEAEAEVVFNKLPKEINGKPFVRDPTEGKDGKDGDGKGNKEDYSLYVNNIPQGVTVEEVQALFPSARNVVIPLNEEDQNQGYAIVECHSLQDAETIISENKELKLKENVLTFDLISHTAKDDDDKKSRKSQNNQQNKKGRFSNFQNRRNQQVNKKGKRQQQMQQMQQRKQRWSPDRRQQGRRGPGQFMQRNRMDGGNRRQLMDGGNWNHGGQNVTAALSQTSELLKGLTSLLGQQLLNPNQMGGQGSGQYGNQSWGQGMDQGNNYGGYQSGNRGYGNDNMNYGNSGYGGWGGSYRGGYN